MGVPKNAARNVGAATTARISPPHVLTTVSTESTSFSMRATRDIAYNVIQLTSHVFDVSQPALAALVGRRPLLIAFDEAVYALFGSTIRAYAREHLNVFTTVTLKAGESHKHFDQVERVCEAAIAAGLPRNGVMIGVGGGRRARYCRHGRRVISARCSVRSHSNDAAWNDRRRSRN